MITIAALKALLDHLEEGVVFIDAGRRVVEVNAAAERLLGRDGAGLHCSIVLRDRSREVVRLGENHPHKVDVRVVAATHRDLDAMVRAGAFREDLYYRLRVLPLRVPSLRERAGDIPLLAAHMLGALAERCRRAPPRVSPEALAALEACRWPGNVRQSRRGRATAGHVAHHAVEAAEGRAGWMRPPDAAFRRRCGIGHNPGIRP